MILASSLPQVSVTDVNDNPPFLSEPKGGVEVGENGEPKMVTNITLGDPDDWRLGHGPPFSLVLDPRAPQHVSSVVRVVFDPSEYSEAMLGGGGESVSVSRGYKPVVCVC